MTQHPVTTLVYTCSALIAFAGNSVLCRLALGEGSIDAASFTDIRLLSGIAVLVVISFVVVKFDSSDKLTHNITSETESDESHLAAKAGRSWFGKWLAAGFLFLYAVSFSYGYLSIDTGTGALVLFGAVQVTMILANVLRGNALRLGEWVGLGLAFAGFVYLVMPSIGTPSLAGLVLMSLSGIAWGVYTLLGMGSSKSPSGLPTSLQQQQSPLQQTTDNFLRTLPFVLMLGLYAVLQADSLVLTERGIWLAVASGALASGCGYALWYVAIQRLSVTTTAVVQLFVPIIAALGGVMFNQEALTLRLVLASGMVLGGVLLVILSKTESNSIQLTHKH